MFDLYLYANRKLRLQSCANDCLHRPDAASGVSTWGTGVGNEWIIEPVLKDSLVNKARLKSWKDDYLVRPDSPLGVSTGGMTGGHEWIIEPVGQEKIRIKSWKGDYLCRSSEPYGVTTGPADASSEWLVDPLEPVVPPVPVDPAVNYKVRDSGNAWTDIVAVKDALYKYAKDYGRYMVAEPYQWWLKVSKDHIIKNFLLRSNIPGNNYDERAVNFMRLINDRIKLHRTDETVNGRVIGTSSWGINTYEQIPVYTFVIDSYEMPTVTAKFTMSRSGSDFVFSIFGRTGRVSIQVGEAALRQVLENARNPDDVVRGIANEGFNFWW